MSAQQYLDGSPVTRKENLEFESGARRRWEDRRRRIRNRNCRTARSISDSRPITQEWDPKIYQLQRYHDNDTKANTGTTPREIYLRTRAVSRRRRQDRETTRRRRSDLLQRLGRGDIDGRRVLLELVNGVARVLGGLERDAVEELTDPVRMLAAVRGEENKRRTPPACGPWSRR